MKYEIGDRVEYYYRGEAGIGVIEDVSNNDCSSHPYMIEGCIYSESKEKERELTLAYGQYIIKKIPEDRQKYKVGDRVEYYHNDNTPPVRIGTIKEISKTTGKTIFNLNCIPEYIVDGDFVAEAIEINSNRYIIRKIVEKISTVGRPLKFKTVEELQSEIDQYLNWVKENEKPLTVERLACFLGCDRETLLNYGKLEGREEFFGTIKRIKSVILADKAERLNSPEGNKAGVIFDLKNNHGFKDRNETEHSTPDGKPFQIENNKLSDEEIDARILELTLKTTPSQNKG